MKDILKSSLMLLRTKPFFVLFVLFMILSIFGILFEVMRNKKESFIENLEVYKDGVQTFRKCKREVARKVEKNAKMIKEKTNRYVRKCRI